MNILQPKLILATAVGVLIGGVLATFIQGIYAAPVQAASQVSSAKAAAPSAKPAEVKKETFPVAMTPSQLKQYHDVERFYDSQMGVVCYRMIGKNVMSCMPVGQTYMRPGRAGQQP